MQQSFNSLAVFHVRITNGIHFVVKERSPHVKEAKKAKKENETTQNKTDFQLGPIRELNVSL